MNNKSGFTGKNTTKPKIKAKSTAKKAPVPKSANYKTAKEGDWGRN